MSELRKAHNAIVSYLREPYLDSIGLLAESKADIGLMRESGVIIKYNQSDEIYNIINSGDHNLEGMHSYDMYEVLQKQYMRELIKHYKQHPDLLFVTEGALAGIISNFSIKEWHNGTRLQDLGVAYYFYTGKHQGLPSNTLQLPDDPEGYRGGVNYNYHQVFNEDSYTYIQLAVQNKLYKKYPDLFKQVSYERWVGDLGYLTNIQVHTKYPSRNNQVNYTLTKERLALNIHQLILTYKDEMSSDEQGLRLLEALTNLKKGLEGYYELQILKEQYTHSLDDVTQPVQRQKPFKPMSESEKLKFRQRQEQGNYYNGFREMLSKQTKKDNQELLKQRERRLSGEVIQEDDDDDELFQLIESFLLSPK